MGDRRFTLLLACAVGLASGAAGSWIVGHTSQRNRAYDSVHPPIAVVDYAQATRNPGVSVDVILDDLDDKARRLKEAGFLVINRSAVAAYPSELEIQWTNSTADPAGQSNDG